MLKTILATATGLTMTIAMASIRQAQAQQESRPLWLSGAYTYSVLNNSTPNGGSNTTQQKGQLAGVRGELGFALAGALSVSGAGEYQDGNLNYDGTPLAGASLQQVSKDYIGDLRGLVHLASSSVTVSGGVGERYWYDDLVTSYRRRVRYKYYPILLTVNLSSALYMKLEYDLWSKGSSKVQMSDLGGGRSDVEFKTKKGSGYAAEIGMLMGNASRLATRLYVRYQRWDVQDSDMQNDGVSDLQEKRNSTVIYQGGIGLDF